LVAAFGGIEHATGYDFDTDTGRWEGRDFIAVLLRRWFAARDLATICEAIAGTGVSWERYQTFSQFVAEDPRCSTDKPMFAEVEHPGVGTYLTPGSPLSFSGTERTSVRRARCSATHTEEILAELLDFSAAEIGRLHDAAVVAGQPQPRAVNASDRCGRRSQTSVGLDS
jgi:2-methylfumaryl-CoA isomerase